MMHDGYKTQIYQNGKQWQLYHYDIQTETETFSNYFYATSLKHATEILEAGKKHLDHVVHSTLHQIGMEDCVMKKTAYRFYWVNKSGTSSNTELLTLVIASNLNEAIATFSKEFPDHPVEMVVSIEVLPEPVVIAPLTNL